MESRSSSIGIDHPTVVPVNIDLDRSGDADDDGAEQPT